MFLFLSCWTEEQKSLDGCISNDPFKKKESIGSDYEGLNLPSIICVCVYAKEHVLLHTGLIEGIFIEFNGYVQDPNFLLTRPTELSDVANQQFFTNRIEFHLEA